ncbi:cytochrome P450 [Hypoxylon sp. NC1633]|nr:cytochrome P450 [Hypoxylon sp. NC1633]
MSISLNIVGAVLVVFLYKLVRSCISPLWHIPGPLIARLTPIWLWYISWAGVECTVIEALHKKYGPVVLIAPNEVDLSDGAAVPAIYVKSGGFLKSPVYRNFDVNGFATIFSVTDPAHRAIRAKAVAPLFAQKALLKDRLIVQRVADAMISELERRKAAACGRPIDVLNLFRAFTIDSVAHYLLGSSFNGIEEKRLSATAFVDNFASGGRFFLLPCWIFKHVDHWAAKFHKDKEAIQKSTLRVREFATQVVDESLDEGKGDCHTYQGRLLHAGISREETISQVMDILFAGTDGTARTMAVLVLNLVRHPEKYKRARKEVIGNSDLDPQSLPYLSGIVKESLRLSMANPTRLPRVVPKGGLHVPGLPSIHAGTIVGAGAYTLHLNPDVFPQPHEFMPERWLEPTPEMLRDSFSFGQGPRQCIARNLASAMLLWVTETLVRSDVLRGAKPAKDSVEYFQWFNSVVCDGKIELFWESNSM